ncbi:MAG: META domain-containing protein [Anaerolineae bacterium]|nr:META domain-containing protein [Anaerolineae bacterium]
MKKYALVFLMLLLAMMLAACSGTAGSEPTAEPEMEATTVPAAEETPPTITGILWQWQEFQDSAEENDITVDNPANYNIVFNEDGTYNGQADCNRIAGSYTLDGASLTIQPGISTMAMCPEGSLDAQFNTFLSNVRTFVMDEDDLVMNLFADAGNMVFSNGGPAPADMPAETAPITGILWLWQEYQDTGDVNNITVDNPANYNIVFNEDGTYSGQADCNRIAGSYTLDDASLTIQPGISTMAMCPEGSLDAQFNTFLSNVRTFVMDGEDLVMNLFADAGNMVFSNGGPAPVTMAEVTGTVSYLVRIALPDDANLLVQLQDTSLADAPALVMGEYNAPTNGAQVPLPFAIPYDPAAIVDNHTYTLSARIIDGAGNLLFINDTSIPAITGGNPTTDVEVLVVQVNP